MAALFLRIGNTFLNLKLGWKQQDWEGKELDKDILIDGNKVYSPETCVFVSKDINLFFTNRSSLRGVYPLGVFLDHKYGKFKVTIGGNGKRTYLGTYDDPITAFKAWGEVKLKMATELAKLNPELGYFLVLKTEKIIQKELERIQLINWKEVSNVC